MVQSHRLSASGPDGMGHQPEQEVGHDDRAFDTGVKHVQNHRVAKMKPVIKDKTGPYISNLIDGPSAWHGEEPTLSAQTTHDEYLQAEHMATMPSEKQSVPNYYPDPVPVIVVPPDSGPESMTAGRANKLGVDVSGGAALEIVPKDMHRRRVTIRNEHATVGVRIGHSEAEAHQGFLLTAGDARDFGAQSGIWAWPVDGTTVIPVSFYAEYSRNV